MESGSIEAIAARLESWCNRGVEGLVRIEFDQVQARKAVNQRLRVRISRPWFEIELPEASVPAEVVVRQIQEQLQAHPGGVAAITGLEWALPADGRLENLVALSFQREALASFPVLQLWWVPSHLTSRFVLGSPDLDSWFRMRLHLTEVISESDASESLSLVPTGQVGVEEAQALGQRFWQRSESAKAQGLPLEKIWMDLAAPAVESLRRAGLELEAEAILRTDVTKGLEDRIKTLQETRGPEDPELQRLMLMWAGVLMERGSLLSARQLEEEVLAVRTRLLGSDDLDTIEAAQNLARTLAASGNLAAARALQEKVVSVRRQRQGERHKDTLEAMHNLAQTLYSQGDLGGARVLEERALEELVKTLGPDDPETLPVKNSLAGTLFAQGDLAGARSLQRDVLASARGRMGAEHPNTLSAMNNLARTLKTEGNLDEALELQRRVLEANQRILGVEHPNSLTALNNLAQTLVARGDLSEAGTLLEQVVDSRTRVLGPENPATLTAISNLAQVLASQGRLDKARELQVKVLDARRRVLGSKNPSTLAAMNNLAKTLALLGDDLGARELLEQAGPNS